MNGSFGSCMTSSGGVGGSQISSQLCKRKLLFAFVTVMQNQSMYDDMSIRSTLCHIILQRFMARVSVSSEIMTAVVQFLNCNGVEAKAPEEKDILQHVATTATSCTAIVETMISQQHKQPVHNNNNDGKLVDICSNMDDTSDLVCISDIFNGRNCNDSDNITTSFKKRKTTK